MDIVHISNILFADAEKIQWTIVSENGHQINWQNTDKEYKTNSGTPLE